MPARKAAFPGAPAVQRAADMKGGDWPILVVPGILGSRLVSKKHGVIWDPDDKLILASLIRSTANQLADWFDPGITGDVDVMVEPPGGLLGGGPTAQQAALGKERGWFGPSWNFYGKGIAAIQEALAPQGAVVYAFGYDWRDDNLQNGRILIERIQEIQKRHGQKVHILTHSMGGLVTRSACKLLGADATALVASVTHTFMPTIGAPEAYLKFKRGEVRGWGPDLSYILGNTAEEVSVICSGVRSVFQLMPTSRYPLPFYFDDNLQDGLPWLVWDNHLAEGLDMLDVTTDPWAVYDEPSGTVGLVEHKSFVDGMKVKGQEITNPKGRLQSLRGNIRRAQKFHTDLGDYLHPCTSLLVGEGIESFGGVSVEADAKEASFRKLTTKMVDGDGTVPELSAGFCRPRVKRVIRGVKHDALFNDEAGRVTMVKMLVEARTASAGPSASAASPSPSASASAAAPPPPPPAAAALPPPPPVAARPPPKDEGNNDFFKQYGL